MVEMGVAVQTVAGKAKKANFKKYIRPSDIHRQHDAEARKQGPNQPATTGSTKRSQEPKKHSTSQP